MTRKEIIKEVAERTGNTQQLTASILAEALAVVRDGLIDGERLIIKGFGTLKQRQRNACVGQNIYYGGTINIPAKKTVVFKPSKEFKNIINSRQ